LACPIEHIRLIMSSLVKEPKWSSCRVVPQKLKPTKTDSYYIKIMSKKKSSQSNFGMIKVISIGSVSWDL
jgi:hypothetical protein